MRDHYHGFSHPVLVDLPAEAPSDLLSEMDVIADELRANPEFVADDDQIAFRQLQKLRGPELWQDQWLDLFAEWRERYDAREAAKAAAASTRRTELWRERDALFEKRASSSSSTERDAATARIETIGRELAELVAPAEMLSLVSSRTE